jgi:hypothetical protein
MEIIFIRALCPLMLNTIIKNELKQYYDKSEIKDIITKTKIGYKNMVENNKEAKMDKRFIASMCSNTYFISLYMNIENKIGFAEYIRLKEKIMNKCIIVKIKRGISYYQNTIIRQKIYEYQIKKI